MQLFVDQITVIDCGVLDRLRGLMGVSWIVDLSLTGEIDTHTGMIVDFGPVKTLVKQRLDALVDHRLLVPGQAAGLDRADTDDGLSLHFHDDAGYRVDYLAPADAVCILPTDTVEPAAIAALLEADLRPRLPDRVSGLSLTLREEAIPGAEYQYCHGLAAHDGNCQRLAHGHRCRLEVEVDGQPSPAHAQRWSRQWRQVFLGSREHLIGDPSTTRHRFGYTADQGRFELELDARRCVLLDGPSTVENIARHIAEQLKREQPNHRFRVRAFEGVHKGAVAET
ncbi:6-carboxytetrahydropterin synthase [Salinisphaera sp. P385]|uniref:6-carboxy-5,6,7,8-tetrahydropterin synthase n=1 Tax=Spectribacter acetivorans TaxID=3075603 RepID=A0ABU3BAR7_9GAMM|nr:6-carboxytetrahydropterin synthase [Salinisphaera sp. P385]MDT0619549.1 6-carboxytetrahydropterin synthase [Salinisphaera sp. P385]